MPRQSVAVIATVQPQARRWKRLIHRYQKEKRFCGEIDRHALTMRIYLMIDDHRLKTEKVMFGLIFDCIIFL